MTKVLLKGVSKRFGDIVAVNNVNLEIADREFVGWDAIYPKIISGIAAGYPPDLVVIPNHARIALASKGALLPVTEIIDELDRSDWIPGSLVRYKGEDYFVPYAVAVRGKITGKGVMDGYIHKS